MKRFIHEASQSRFAKIAPGVAREIDPGDEPISSELGLASLAIGAVRIALTEIAMLRCGPSGSTEQAVHMPLTSERGQRIAPTAPEPIVRLARRLYRVAIERLPSTGA